MDIEENTKMGLYSGTLPCGCEEMSSTLDYPPTTWVSKLCPEHSPKPNTVITYNFAMFLRTHAPHSKPEVHRTCPLPAYVVEGPSHDKMPKTITLRARFPLGTVFSPASHETGVVTNMGYEDYEVVVPYHEGAVVKVPQTT